MFENEEWREIEDFPHYMISNYGRVKRVGQTEARKVAINDRGFPIVTLYGADSKTRYLRQINKLVADAFVPKGPFYDDPTIPENSVWHIDGDLTNCRADNLTWKSRAAVLEWNEMHRTGSRYKHFANTKVKNNRTGVIYENTYECAMAEGLPETVIVNRIEKQALHMEDDNARYRYIFKTPWKTD